MSTIADVRRLKVNILVNGTKYCHVNGTIFLYINKIPILLVPHFLLLFLRTSIEELLE